MVIKLVKCYNQEHQEVEATVKKDNEQTHLYFFEEPRTCLHVYVYQAWAGECYEFILGREQVELALMIEFKVVWSSTGYIHSV